MKLYLATSSKFRINIYKRMGFEIEAIPSDEKEYYEDRSNPIKYVEELSKIKAQSVAKKLNSGIVVGTDTIVVLDDVILEKPKNIEAAKNNMRILQGRDNSVISGITIIDVEKGITKTVYEITKVSIAKMTEEEIEWYANNVSNVLQCAGYSTSTEGGRFVTKMEGDYNNVLGAPVPRVYQELKQLQLINKKY
ncbi:MAG: septum formation protein Maf [Bacilli bacterium]|jgi:septum formation protein|nr:septum formation protein Maf [Bacilli bacterium]